RRLWNFSRRGWSRCSDVARSVRSEGVVEGRSGIGGSSTSYRSLHLSHRSGVNLLRRSLAQSCDFEPSPGREHQNFQGRKVEMATLFRSRIRVEESRNLVAHHQRKKNAVVLGGRSEA